MLIVIFTYDRQDKLTRLLDEVKDRGHKIMVIDDGSQYPVDFYQNRPEVTWWREYSENGGKQEFYKKWACAIDQFLEQTDEEYMLTLADDVHDINMELIEKLTKQKWENSLFAVNVVNDGRDHCWGMFRTGQDAIKIDETWFNEVGFVDCGFLSNRYTMEKIDIDPIPESWFDRPDKSSGVGHQLTKKMRALKVKMMNPLPSLCTHGDHESKMHGDHRKDTPLKSI